MPVGGETLRHGDKEPKPILYVLQFCVLDQPNYGSGIGLSGTQVCEARVAEPGELAGQEGAVRLGLLG